MLKVSAELVRIPLVFPYLCQMRDVGEHRLKQLVRLHSRRWGIPVSQETFYSEAINFDIGRKQHSHHT